MVSRAMAPESTVRYVRFDKGMTNIVKGFAILFMFMLHCYDGYKYDVELDFSHAFMFAHDGFNICVGMYAFMMGFGYSFARNKDWRYSLQHIKKVMIPYWSIFLVFMLPCCYQAFFSSSPKIMLFTLIGLNTNFHFYNWFIYLFVLSMVVLPVFHGFIDKRPLVNTMILVVCVYLLVVLTHPLLAFVTDVDISNFVLNCFHVTPVVLLGYLFAHERYYERIRVNNLPAPLVVVGSILTMLAMLYLCSKLRVRFGFLFDFFYAPVMIGAIAVLFSKFEMKYLRAVLQQLGVVSMYMWFLHASLHTPTIRWFYQPLVTIFSDVNLVVLWTMILVFFVAWAVKSFMDSVLGLSKR